MRKRTHKIDLLAKEIGEKLRTMRKKLDLTQKQLSKKIPDRIDYTYIGKIERGEILPSVRMLRRISEGLNIPVDFFFQKETITSLIGLLPEDIRDISKDNDKIAFFREVKELDKKDVPLVTEIIRILNKHRMSLNEGIFYENFPSTKHAVGLVADKKSHYKKKNSKK